MSGEADERLTLAPTEAAPARDGGGESEGGDEMTPTPTADDGM